MPTTVKEAGDALIDGMRSGAVLDRSGKPYKPKTIRTYEHALDLRVPAAWAPEAEFAQARRHPGLRRGDASQRGFAVHRPQPARPAAVIVRGAIDNDQLMVDPCAGTSTSAPLRPRPGVASSSWTGSER